MSTAETAPRDIDALQHTVGEWLHRAFGADSATSAHVRSARLLEESLELVQTAGLTEAEAIRLVRHVYTRPTGERDQEIGGTALTLLAFCAATNVSFVELAQREVDRVLSMPIEHFAHRNAMKRALGIVAY